MRDHQFAIVAVFEELDRYQRCCARIVGLMSRLRGTSTRESLPDLSTPGKPFREARAFVGEPQPDMCRQWTFP
jgi:hypothetical protein